MKNINLILSDRKPKVIPSKNREYFDKFGISRMKKNKCWWIRLGWEIKNEMRKVQFQKAVYDSHYNFDPKESLSAAIKIRNNEIGKIKFRDRTTINRINPIRCLSLCRSSTNGKYNWAWKFTQNKMGKTFGFWRSGEIYLQFLEAAFYAADQGIEFDHDCLDEYFQFYIQKRKDQQFIDFMKTRAIV
jgi:hypothetical protein